MDSLPLLLAPLVLAWWLLHKQQTRLLDHFSRISSLCCALSIDRYLVCSHFPLPHRRFPVIERRFVSFFASLLLSRCASRGMIILLDVAAYYTQISRYEQSIQICQECEKLIQSDRNL